MKKVCVVLVLFFSALLFPAWCQDADPPRALPAKSLSQIAHETVSELKISVEVLLAQLTEAQNDLTLSEGQRKAFEISVQDLNSSLTSMTTKWQSSETRLIISENNFRRERRIVRGLGIVFGLLILWKIAAAILRARGIKLPWWLD